LVVDIRGDKALFMMPDIGMMTQIKFKNLPQLDEEMQKMGQDIEKVTLAKGLQYHLEDRVLTNQFDTALRCTLIGVATCKRR
jgi:hypothetical protein